MLKNYLTVALRNVAQQRLYSFINIAGLAVALACAILIILFVRDELSFDEGIAGRENLYRVETVLVPAGRERLTTSTSMYALSDALKSDIASVVETARIGVQNSVVRVGDRQAFEPIAVADPNLFHILDFPLLHGDAATVLARPDTLVVSEGFARRYFDEENPIGKVLMLDSGYPVEISGVMADLPDHSHLKINAILRLGSQADRLYGVTDDSHANALSWGNASFYTYVRLAPGTNPDLARAALPDVVRRHVPAESWGGGRGQDIADAVRFELRAYDELHFDEAPGLDLIDTPRGDWSAVRGFSLVAGLIVFIACINFMNLATARATRRAREVGLRKLAGARRGQLIGQFLSESILISFAALALALAIVELLLPAYAQFIDRPMSLNYLVDWDVALGAVGLALLAGLLGGIYPAFVLSGFRPASALQAQGRGPSRSSTVRSGLVVLQFSVSIALGVTAAVVYGQTLFARSFDVGFARENVIILQGLGRDQVAPVREVLRNAFLENPNVIGVVGSSDRPFSGEDNNTPLRTSEDPGQTILVRQLFVEPEFFEIYGIRMIAGRGFSRGRGEDIDNSRNFDEAAPDGASMIINEAAVRRLGYASPADAVGKVVHQDPPVGPNGQPVDRSRVIIGVVADAHFDSLRQPVQPTRYTYNPNEMYFFSIAIKSEQADETAAFIRDTWSRLVPDLPIRLSYLDDTYRSLYGADERNGEMFALFTALAILIACLGLFGLAAFTAERRTKEIGVRKVFGARVRDIVIMLLWQFSRPVLIANLIAWPVAWYYLSEWLDGFAYRISLSPLYFAAAGLAALLIACATVTMHSLRVARAKPIHALRYE